MNRVISGTATDGSGNTSEFGAFVPVQILTIVKKAFTVGGTPIPDGATIPKGMPFKFLLYVNNRGALVQSALGEVSGSQSSD